jgi:hypothetical protein
LHRFATAVVHVAHFFDPAAFQQGCERAKCSPA